MDQLKPPSNYPTPLFVYTVKEMSILWQLFGGNDFQTSKQKKNERFVRQMSGLDKFL